MNDTADRRTIDLQVIVAGTVEEVWQAVATGPGISSWYVPSTVEERADGAVTSQFGPGPEMTVHGRVRAWEPPHRVVFAGDRAHADGMAFEWLVQARDDATCIVRLINSGFGDGGPWDDQYDAMTEGWKLFLRNLQLHREYFPGRHGTAMLAMGPADGDRDEVWARLTAALGWPTAPTVASTVTTAQELPVLSGRVVDCGPHQVWLLLDAPAPGTGFVAVERAGTGCGVSIWTYLYGDGAAARGAEDLRRWQNVIAGLSDRPTG